MTSQPVLDVSFLPQGALDHRSPIWWGNLLLLLIETAMFALLFAAYLYIRSTFDAWPPLKIADPSPTFRTNPDLLLPTVSLVLLLAGVVPMYLADRAAWRMDRWAVRRWTFVSLLLGFAAIGVRIFEFSSVHFLWDENAYASIVWALLVMHLLHQITITTEDSFMLAWVHFKDLEHSHARDVRVTAIYWFWVAGIYVPIYVLVYLSPRFL